MQKESFIHRNKIDLIIFAVALFARLILFSINFHYEHYNLVNTIHGDDGYYEISKDLSLGHGFSGMLAPPYQPNALRTPIYPWFIALGLIIFKSYWVVIALQILFGSFIPVFGYRIASKVTSSKSISLWTGLALSLQPYLILFSSIFYTETLFIFFFLIFILFFIHYLEKKDSNLLFWSAFFLGIATLTKTTVQYLPILLIPLIFFHFKNRIALKKIWSHILLFLFVFMVTLAPWLYRSYKLYGVIGMSAQPAFNLYVYYIPSILALEHGTSFDAELKKNVAPAEADGHVIDLSNSSMYTHKALAVIKQHPKGIILSAFVTFVTFFTHDGMLTVLQHAGYTPQSLLSAPALSLLFKHPLGLIIEIAKVIKSPLILIILVRIFWIVLSILFFIGIVHAWFDRGKRNALLAFCIILVAYFCLTSMVAGLGINARYRMPVEPFLFIYAAIGFIFLKGVILSKIRSSS
jgi:4-amino-4-deoxy-L-arabinose transferase-like glycosyltransferase